MSDSPQHVILIPPSREKDPRKGTSARLPLGFFAALRMTVVGVAGLPAQAVSGLIWVYQRTVSPALVVINPTCGCRFAPTCSHYAREALRAHGLFVGVALTVVRLAKCGPWHPGGEDPVPPADHRTTGQQDYRSARRRLPSCTSVSGPSSVVPQSLSHG